MSPQHPEPEPQKHLLETSLNLDLLKNSAQFYDVLLFFQGKLHLNPEIWGYPKPAQPIPQGRFPGQTSAWPGDPDRSCGWGLVPNDSSQI